MARSSAAASSLPRSIRISPRDWRAGASTLCEVMVVEKSVGDDNTASVRKITEPRVAKGLLDTDADGLRPPGCPVRSRGTGKGRRGGLNGRGDILLGMRGRDEAGFVRGRRKIDSGVEHRVEETVEAFLVACHHRGIGIGNG